MQLITELCVAKRQRQCLQTSIDIFQGLTEYLKTNFCEEWQGLKIRIFHLDKLIKFDWHTTIN